MKQAYERNQNLTDCTSTRRELSTVEKDRIGGLTLFMFVLSLCAAPLIGFVCIEQHGHIGIAGAAILFCLACAGRAYRVAAQLSYPAGDNLLRASKEPNLRQDRSS